MYIELIVRWLIVLHKNMLPIIAKKTRIDPYPRRKTRLPTDLPPLY